MADLTCPGCGGVLPECPCRSGLTAGTFSTGGSWPAVTLDALGAAAAALPPPPEFTKVAASERLTGSQQWIDPRSRVLFVSPEAFAKLLKGVPSRAEAPRG